MGTKPRMTLAGLFLAGVALSGCESCKSCRDSMPWGNGLSSSTPVAKNTPSANAGWSNQTRTTAPNALGATARTTTPGNQSPGTFDSSTGSQLTPSGNQPVKPYGQGSDTKSLGMPASFSTSNPTDRSGISSTTPSSFLQGTSGGDRGQSTGSPATDDLNTRSPAPLATPARGPQLDPSANSGGPPPVSNGVPPLPSGPEPTGRLPSLNTVPTAAPQPTWPPATSSAPGIGAGAKGLEPPPVRTPGTTDSSYQTKYPPPPASPVPVMPKPGGQNPDE
jgi:hypothetical protein